MSKTRPVCDGTCAGNEFGDCNHGDSNDGLSSRPLLQHEVQELRDALVEAELTIERMRTTALRLRAVALEARAHVGPDPRLRDAIRDLDAHDEAHGVWAHIDEAIRRGLMTFESEEAERPAPLSDGP